jgi:hypothetical protein
MSGVLKSKVYKKNPRASEGPKANIKVKVK